MKSIARAVLVVSITFCFAIGASGATFVVNTTSDTADAAAGDGACADASSNCSLRAAISEANALAGPDIITLGAANYMQTLGPSEENLNAGGDWDIRSDITINGVDQATTILQAPTCLANRDRVLDIGSGTTVTLNDLTISNGCLSTVAPGAGAGILSSGSLTLNDVTVRDNFVQNFEGGAAGGGIFNSGGSLTLNDSTVTNNRAAGAMFGAAYGGGILSQSSAPVVINNSSISGNQADGTTQQGFGGGMYTSNTVNLTITNSHFDNNNIQGTAGGSAGAGLYIRGDTTIPSALATITACTFNNNTSSGANVNGVGLSIVTADQQFGRITVKLDRSTISGNSGSGSGAGMQVFPDQGSIDLDVSGSTFSNNTAGATGGGVDLTTVGGELDSEIYSSFTNTTVSGNSGTIGGGFAVRSEPGNVTVDFQYCTLTNNTGSVRGGGLGDSSGGGGFIYLERTVLAGNTAPAGTDIFAEVFSIGYNHFGSASGMTIIGGLNTHLTTGPAMLGPLQNNGGPTPTHLPDAGSPLVDAIPIGQRTCSPSSGTITVYGDQRGFGRPFGTGCDKGAVERGASLAAGPWTLSGSTRTTAGMPIRNVAVQISGGNLPAPVTVFTGNLGTFQFSNLTGNDYTVTVTAKRFHFIQSIVVFSVGSNITNADFVANAPFSREALDLKPPAVKAKDRNMRSEPEAVARGFPNSLIDH
jgi:CSLREA domain-containing protein